MVRMGEQSKEARDGVLRFGVKCALSALKASDPVMRRKPQAGGYVRSPTGGPIPAKAEKAPSTYAILAPKLPKTVVKSPRSQTIGRNIRFGHADVAIAGADHYGYGHSRRGAPATTATPPAASARSTASSTSPRV